MESSARTVPDCTGQCCERFFLPLRPKSLDDIVSETARRSRGGAGDVRNWNSDMPLWAPLLRYLGDEPTRPDGGWWSCAAYSPEHRLCRIYELRPDTCAAYPYGRKCDYCQCKGFVDD